MSQSIQTQSSISQSSFGQSSSSISHPIYPHHRRSRHTRGRTLGLIDAARVKLSKDFPALLRSSSFSSHPGSSIPPESEDAEDQKTDGLDDAHALFTPRSVDFPVKAMDSHREERHGRSFGSRIVDFLSRSRSRSHSKKRRSRSLDDVPIGGLPTFPQFGSSSSSKPSTRFQSRPISSATTATNTTIKPRSKKPPELKPVSGASDHRVHIQTEVLPLEATTSNPSRKGKKLNIFSMAIPHAMKSSDDHKTSRSGSPAPERAHWTQRFRSGSSSSQVAPKGLGGRDASNNSRISHGSPSPHATSARPSAPPPLPRNADAHYGYDVGPEDEVRNGRCSPLCGLPSPTIGAMGKDKGKEKECPYEPRSRTHLVERGWGSAGEGKERITGPRRVGSPIRKESSRDSRTAVTATAMEKVSSGSGTSRRSSRDPVSTSAPGHSAAAIKAKQVKHGSFDFERPISTAHGMVPIKSALKQMTAGPSDVPLQRGNSLKVASQPSESLDQPKTQQPPEHTQHGSWRKSRKPRLDVKTDATPARRGTDSSMGSSNPPSGSNTSRNHVNFAEPDTPNSSHSGGGGGGGGSWGKNTGKHALRGSHGPFKFEPAVPPIPGSPADELKGNIMGGHPKYPTAPSKLQQELAPPAASGGRSLDLNLGLSWAPSKVREEAVLIYGKQGGASLTGSTGRARARWKSGWVDEEGRLGSSTSRPAGSDVAEAFREALGPAAYATFKTYVHRFDAHAIPLNGPYGLISHARRLLDTSDALDDRGKQALLEKFTRFVENNQ